MNQEDGFGAASRMSQQLNMEIRSNLTAPRKYIGVGRAIGKGVGAFHMTRCRERQARGKGLACHFLQIVPTCL
jgi:hypothetical protein